MTNSGRIAMKIAIGVFVLLIIAGFSSYAASEETRNMFKFGVNKGEPSHKSKKVILSSPNARKRF